MMAAAQAADTLVRMLWSVEPVEHALYAERHGLGTIAVERPNLRPARARQDDTIRLDS